MPLPMPLPLLLSLPLPLPVGIKRHAVGASTGDLVTEQATSPSHQLQHDQGAVPGSC